jgi:tetratricopeptide (TPR) repeat protein
MTLNNLAILHKVKNDLTTAEHEYKEALDIRRKLANSNPDVYLSYVAKTLNNLAVLHSDKNEFTTAENEYKEALDITKKLANSNSDVYFPDVAMTAVNFSYFYLQYTPNKEKSLDLAAAALLVACSFLEVLPVTKQYFNAALQIFEAWGEDVQAYMENHNQATA